MDYAMPGVMLADVIWHWMIESWFEESSLLRVIFVSL